MKALLIICIFANVCFGAIEVTSPSTGGGVNPTNIIEVVAVTGGVLYSPSNTVDDIVFNTEIVRKILNPSSLSTYLDIPFTTETLTADTWTKVVFTNIVVKYAQDFAYDTPNSRFFLDTIGVTNRPFKIWSEASISGGTLNSLANIAVYKNGTIVAGGATQRYFEANADVGSLTLIATVDLTDDDYLEIFAKFSAADTLTFKSVTIIISEGH